jgi:TRAP-type transport system periplasmic protein
LNESPLGFAGSQDLRTRERKEVIGHQRQIWVIVFSIQLSSDKEASMKRILVLVVVYLLVGGFFLYDFAEASEKRPMVLQYEFWLPPKSPEWETMVAFYKGLEDATGGAVKVQFNPSGTMGKPDGTYQRTLQGINNIGHFNPGFNVGIFPMWEIFHYPIHCPSSEALARFQIGMYEKGYFDKEFANVKVTSLFNIGSYLLFSNKKISTVEDLKGVKIRTIGEGWADVCKAVGAVPVSLPTGEMFLALQKGIVDSVANVWDASHVFKLNEVSKYVNEMHLMSSTHIEAWNKKTWDALPLEGKKYIDANWKKYSIDCAKKYDDLIPTFKKEFLATGPDREINEFSSEEFMKLDKLLKPVWEGWITERESKGFPAKKAVADLYKMMKNAGLQDPIAGFTPQ